MKIETKFHPITITLETSQEFDYLWDALEQALPTYEKNSSARNFLIDAINTMGEVHSFQPTVDEVNTLINNARDRIEEEQDDASTWDDKAKEIWK
jgi:hypothetical protein